MSIKLVEAFAGYGSQRMALKNLGIAISKDSKIIEWTIDAIIANAAAHHPEEFKEQIKLVANSPHSKEQKIQYILNKYTLSTEKKKDEDKNYVPVDEAQLKRMKEDFIDKIIASNMVTNNLGSIMDTKGNEIANMDLFTYSFPCQDLSLAGNMKGITQTSRSGLLYQVERILKEQNFEERPKVLLLENVKNLVGKKFKSDFDTWIKTLDELGYWTTWKVLNAREHGVPQNRERVFAVSIKKDQTFSTFNSFDFDNIKPEPLDKRLKHYLEDKVDESFYLSDEHIQRILGWKAFEKPLKKVLHQESIDVGTITTRSGDDTSSQKLVMDNVEHKENHINVEDILNGKNTIMGVNPQGPTYRSDNTIHGESYYVSTLRAGNGTQLVAIKEIPKEQILELAKQFNTTDLVIEKENELHFVLSDGSTRKIGYRQNEGNWLLPISRNYSQNIVGGEIIPTLMTGSRNIVENIIPLRIRKITPKEALRLMGVNDISIDNIFEHITSKGPQYKLAGNSIVVDVLERIFKELYIGQ